MTTRRCIALGTAIVVALDLVIGVAGALLPLEPLLDTMLVASIAGSVLAYGAFGFLAVRGGSSIHGGGAVGGAIAVLAANVPIAIALPFTGLPDGGYPTFFELWLLATFGIGVVGLVAGAIGGWLAIRRAASEARRG